jgi:phosphatidylglycerol:prolipoprotein diacylglycerol transferase
MYLFGFAFAMWLAGRRADAPNSGWTRNEVSDLLFYGFLGVILGGRIGYVLFYNFDLFLADPPTCSRYGPVACRSTAASSG